MEENKSSIFSQKALDKVTSPEDLNGYLKVTRPGIWFVLIAFVILLIGVIAWAILGRLETTVNVAVISSNNSVVCLVPTESCEDVLSSGKIKISDKEYTLKDAGYSKMTVTEDIGADIINNGLLTAGQEVIPLQVDAKLMNGVYVGNVVTEAVKPITFIIN